MNYFLLFLAFYCTNLSLAATCLVDLCLGDYYFEAANILRNSLLLSTLLSNSETWYDITKREISELESVDNILLRKIFSAHSKTPLETEISPLGLS